MSRRELIDCVAVWPLCKALLCAAACVAATVVARAQDAPALAPSALPAPAPPGSATVGEAAGATVTNLPAEVQVVQFNAPEGVVIEVLGPPPEPVPALIVKDAATFGLKMGIGYRLRITNIPNRAGAVLYPVLEVVGHLHRPPDVEPGRFPIRVMFREIDFEDAVDSGRLVTQVVYLEDPDQALPMSLPKDEIPVTPLSAAEDPLRVAAALGRAMVVVRLGGRIPDPDEWSNSGSLGLAPTPCPFSSSAGGRCGLPLGPSRGTPPPPGHTWLPRDEYLCDGGDRGEPVHFSGEGNLRGLEPRDAVIRFLDDRRPRVLPTNMVCIYAPRFAAVRTSIGANETLSIAVPRGTETLERQVTQEVRQEPKRFVQNQTAEAYRHRGRASGLTGRILPGEFAELRVLEGYETVTHIAGNVLIQGPEVAQSRQKGRGVHGSTGPITIKTAEAPVVTGIVEGASATVMAWKPQELAGVELPHNRPGVVVIKHANVAVAEPGDVITISIQYRNMGNVPVRSVSVIDSLMPRLEYQPGSAVGPPGTVFSATENLAGSSELRWDLPGALEPGKEGYVSFQARVR